MVEMFDNELRCQLCHKSTEKLKRFCGDNWLCTDCYEKVTNGDIELVRATYIRRSDGRRYDH